MVKILVALDGSENALKAVHFAATQFCSGSDNEVVLFHVRPFLPPQYWDDGHILTDEEREARKKVIDVWTKNQAVQLAPTFSAAQEILATVGVQAGRSSTKWRADSIDIADTICEEARTGDYAILVIGRRGRSNPKERIGFTTESIIKSGAGIPICIVE
ncbi:MAG TPA: universal stress protein [Dissulfurispiraceae bacterium]|nr:universal stress protein [Dissulfurispiraceae bacterium]